MWRHISLSELSFDKDHLISDLPYMLSSFLYALMWFGCIASTCLLHRTSMCAELNPSKLTHLSFQQKALEAAMNDINSSFGRGSVTRLGSAGGALVYVFFL